MKLWLLISKNLEIRIQETGFIYPASGIQLPTSFMQDARYRK